MFLLPSLRPPPGRGRAERNRCPPLPVAKAVPNFGRPRKIVADTRRGSARRGRAPVCAGCAVCDARAVCADRRPAGQHARPCVRRAATLRVPVCRTYDPTPARVRESTRCADCNADVKAPSTGTLRKCVPTKRITRTTGIDRRRSEHRGPGGLGGWRDDATETSGGRLEDVRGQLSHRQKAQRVVMEDRLAAGRRPGTATARAVAGRPCSVILQGRRLDVASGDASYRFSAYHHAGLVSYRSSGPKALTRPSQKRTFALPKCRRAW